MQELNRLYRLRETLLGQGAKITDLVSGNVTDQGIQFPVKVLERAIVAGLRQTKVYRPDPLGRMAARQAISRYYADTGLTIPPDHILMTPGTSISYWYAFKTLANPGDDILVPAPSYPLFETIAKLSGVNLIPYRLLERERWELDFEWLTSAMTPRSRAIVLISPHNPTGAVATVAEVRQLVAIAARQNLALISDEVFSPFVYHSKTLPRPAQYGGPLVLTLNGFSKMLALPGVKIGWMAVTGDSALVAKTIKALDNISDTFLPVSESAQAAVPGLLKTSRSFQIRYIAEVRRRMEVATSILNEAPELSFLAPEGGFYMALKLRKAGIDEEDVAYRLLEKHHILVHPGYFYDMDGRHLVLSFASRPAVLRKALQKIIEEIR